MECSSGMGAVKVSNQLSPLLETARDVMIGSHEAEVNVWLID